MAIEKAFAIKAEPADIWRAIVGELEGAEESAYGIERTIPNELLSLRVQLQGGIGALLTYRLIPREGHTEVVATMEPEGLRYAIFRMITMGRADTNFEMLLVEGLANLKRAVELKDAGADPAGGEET